MDRPDSIARGLRRIRIEHGWQQREVAALLGVHTSTVSRIESGNRKVRWPFGARVIAERLGVQVGYLLRDCPQCAYKPPHGYQCLRCGTVSEGRGNCDHG
jgi:transcriptional regulator with XRE-family HTH domain